MKRFLMIMLVAVVFMATSAQAANGKMYFSGSAGVSITDDVDFPGLNISFSPGFNVGGALGYDAGQFRVEGEITYRSVDVDEVNGVPVPLDATFSALSFMANGYYDFEMGSPLTPYLGVGLGIVDSEVDVAGFGSTSETDLAYQFMAGLGYEVSPNVVLTGGYRYFGIAETDAPGTHEFNIGARFMF
jgi:OOP family OmpA-OmpF porin